MSRSLDQCRLYGIVDVGYVSAADAPRVTREMLRGGIDVIQLRAKARSLDEIARLGAELHRITADSAVPLVINDHAEVARESGAEGVHVGQDDRAVAEARAISGERCFIGKSTHSLEQAMAAEAEGADYIGFGPLFATPTKPDYTPIGLEQIRRAHELVSLPIFCIGGIKLENLAQVIAAGAQRVVIVSGLLQAADVAEYARAAKEMLVHRSSATRA
ncbi:MAG TPA: thiamine phosphate synthase [Chthoniobacterales bacterium]|nr:thiamine phosphate synthase [Chthoniobacterales bacterium]